jgi:hypothetical protein
MKHNRHHISTIVIASGILLLMPLVVFAQAPGNFRDVVSLVMRFLQGLIGIAWIVLLVVFIYGVVKFLVNFDDERAREEGKRSMVFTLVATAVVFMIWGIMSLLNNSFFGTTTFGIPILTPPEQAAP